MIIFEKHAHRHAQPNEQKSFKTARTKAESIYVQTFINPAKRTITHWLSTRKRVYTLNTQCTYPIVGSG